MRASLPTTRAAPGLTLVETILAVVMLAMIAATFSAVISMCARDTRTLEQRLAAAEMASRLVVMYIDDKDSLPVRGQPVAYNNRPGVSDAERMLFNWSIDDGGRVGLEPSQAATRSVSSIRGSVRNIEDRVTLVRVHVWLAAESGGSVRPSPLVPHATAVRLYDPASFNNRDSTIERIGTLEDVEDVINDFIGGETIGGPDGSGGNQ